MKKNPLQPNDLTYQIIGCVFKVHSTLSPGLLESAYENCFEYELLKNSLKVQRQLAPPLVYDDIKFDAGYRIVLLINNEVIIELKTVECLAPINTAQVITYLKLSGKKLGVLINFNETDLKRI